MLTFPEQLIFILLFIVSVLLSIRSFSRMYRIIDRGQDKLHFDHLFSRIVIALSVLFTQKTVFKNRPVLSIVHALIAWAFILYFLVNLGDVLTGFITNYHFFGQGVAGNTYRIFVDIFSVMALLGVCVFLFRRFVYKSKTLATPENIQLLPEAGKGVRRDSLIVGLFILGHVGFRFLGESFYIGSEGTDSWQPFAAAVASIWSTFDPITLTTLYHICWWLAIGLILIFIPYFPLSKHAHLFMGPINYLTQPHRSAPGTMEKLDFEAEDAEQFGVAKLEQLDKTQILDAFACIMCNRCQDVCPAFITGKELSPSALEINKRYFINTHRKLLAEGQDSGKSLIDFALSESALWACTSCAACVEVCPVGNEPMFDILNIRRDRVMMESEFPKQLQNAFNGMERNSNPWNMNEDRMKWVSDEPDLRVPTVEEQPDFEVLFWVGCAGAFESRAQNIVKSFAKIMNKAEVKFAVLGNSEKCTGDSARRAGNEYLFSMMAEENVSTLNSFGVKKIVTTCPHCLHTLKNEYPQFGGNFQVIHHSVFINQLIKEKKLKPSSDAEDNLTYHDPCYLGRQNGILNEPRENLQSFGFKVHEMKRNNKNSFCCGAGGAQMWKEEEQGNEDVRKNRFIEAQETPANMLATSCPFCMTMLSDAAKELESDLVVKDIAEIIAGQLG